MNLLDGNVAIITGGAAGIGRGIARRYAREGASVVIADIEADAGEIAAEEIRRDLNGRAQAISVDVTSQDAVRELFAKTREAFGGVDIVVNNAFRPAKDGLFERKTIREMEGVMGVNFNGTWIMMQESLPYLQARGGGRIINFFSIDGALGSWMRADYNASKAAIRALTRTVAAEWARFNILVNCISPAGKGKSYEAWANAIPGYAEQVAAMIPVGRVGDPEEDIGPVAVFLASKMSHYITGETIFVDGGLHITGYQSKPENLEEIERGSD